MFQYIYIINLTIQKSYIKFNDVLNTPFINGYIRFGKSISVMGIDLRSVAH